MSEIDFLEKEFKDDYKKDLDNLNTHFLNAFVNWIKKNPKLSFIGLSITVFMAFSGFVQNIENLKQIVAFFKSNWF